MIRNHHQANSTKSSCCISLEISLNPPEPSTFRGCSSCSHLAFNLCSELPEPFHYFNAFKPTSINLPINIKQPSIELVFSQAFSTLFNVYLHSIQCIYERGQTSLCSASLLIHAIMSKSKLVPKLYSPVSKYVALWWFPSTL